MDDLIVVTGSSGFVGGSFVGGYAGTLRLVGVDLRPGPHDGGLVGRLLVDVSDAGALMGALGSVSTLGNVGAVVHCAAIISPSRCEMDPRSAFIVNTLGTVNMLEYARRADVGLFVYISTGGIYRNSSERDVVTEEWPKEPRGIYGVTKLAAELAVKHYAETYGIDACALRITAPYGPGMFGYVPGSAFPDALSRHALVFAVKCVLGEDIVMPFGGDHTVNYTYIDDITYAIYLCLVKRPKGFHALNVAGGKNYRIRELGEVVKKLCPNIRVEIGGGDLLTSGVRGDPLLERLSIKQGLFDVSRAKEVLGYSPRFGLEEGMGRLIEHLRRAFRARS